MHNSSLTPSSLQSALSAGWLRDESRFNPAICLEAVNQFLEIYQPREAELHPDFYQKRAEIALDPVDGFDLSQLEEIANTSEIKIYKNSVQPENLLLPHSSENLGDYRITGTVIYSSHSALWVVYRRKLDQLTEHSDLIPINSEAETALKLFVISFFYDTEGQKALAQDFESRFSEKIADFFRSKNSVIVLD